MARWFPEVVDERAARVVATGVVVLGAVGVLTAHPVVFALLAGGFLARVVAGPRLSPLALLATRVVVPRLAGPARLTPGPPKRFAQSIGLAFSTAALVLALAGADTGARAVAGALVGAALLEAAAGVCVGCRLFAALMRVGLIPRDVCDRCVA